MPTTFTAKEGDTLCSIAHTLGFAECTALRGANPDVMKRAKDACELIAGETINIPDFEEKEEDGSTEETHSFVIKGRSASIRFVHGTPNLPYADDPTLNILNVSNYVTTRAGTADGNKAMPNDSVRMFNGDGHADADTFKIEVLDIKAAGDLKVELEALRPLYNLAGVLTGHESFPTPRKLPDIVASKMGSTQRFRSCYLRLVVDTDDQAAVPKQTLLTSDLHDDGDSKVEILDQLVKASYEIPTCPESPKCKAVVSKPIGTDRKRLRLTMRVLNNTVGGAPVVPLASAERRIFTWFRRNMAQAAVGPKLMKAVEAVDPTENLVAISNDSGLTAAGDGTLIFRANATGKTSQTATVTPKVGDSPLKTANALAAQITAPFVAKVSKNPARFNDPVGQGSVDILITEASGLRVDIDNVTSGDSRQTLIVARVTPTNFQSWAFPVGNNNWNAGSYQQRSLLRNYDTGDDRIDIYVIDTFDGNNDRAEAMMSNHKIEPTKASVAQIKNSVFMDASTMNTGNDNPYVLAHEVGHVVGEVVHAPVAAPPNNAQIMERGGTEVAGSVTGSKRIRDGAVTYDGPRADFNLIARMRMEGRFLLENW